MSTTIPENEIEVVKGLEHITATGLGAAYPTIEPIPLRCDKCKNVNDFVIPIFYRTPNNSIFRGIETLYYCKTCFKNFLNT